MSTTANNDIHPEGTPPHRVSASRRELVDKVVQASVDARRMSNNTKHERHNSLSQLRLAELHLHGRDEDLKILRSKLLELKKGKAVNENNAGASRPELILVSGETGTGKSALVERGLRDPAQRMGLAFAGGKFDLNQTALPLSAFVEAMSSLTKYAVERGSVQQIRENIHSTFGKDEIALLVRTFPGCDELFHANRRMYRRRNSLGREMSEVSVASLVGMQVVMCVQYAIGRLLNIICSELKGVVLFLDDLQWSDAVTLDLLKRISLESEIQSLLIVGAYREDEVQDSHPLALQIREMEEMGIVIMKIKIGNLSSSDVKSLVAEALGMEDKEDAVETLATTVHKKTRGNAFFVLVFLISLQEEELLQYNFGAMRWLWDDDAVKEKLVTENVASVLVKKLKRLDDMSHGVLKVAACLGSRFNISVISTVVDTLSTMNETEPTPDRSASDTSSLSSSLSKSVIELENEGLWEIDTEGVCRFGHDQIQSAAFELIPSDQQDSFRGRIGSILMTKLDPEDLNDCLFEVVSLRNFVMPSSGDERKELAQANLQAGRKASENAAFETAAIYFKAGRDFLGPQGWEEDYMTMLQLCSEGANACFADGDYETMNALVKEVLSKDIPIEAKFQVFEVKVLAAQAAGDIDGVEGSLNTALEVRKQLGLPAPPNKPASKIKILKEFIKTIRMLKGLSAEDIANLPELTDKRIIMGQRMNELIVTASFQAQPTLFPLISFLLVKTSLRYGINASSCEAFATMGVVFGALGQTQRSRDMANVVDRLLQNPNMKRMKSRSIFICEGFIRHHTSSLQGTLDSHLIGYQIGLETGDVESACANLGHRCRHLFWSGRPLNSIKHELQISADVHTQFNQLSQWKWCITLMLAVENLRGNDVEVEGMDFDGIFKEAIDTKNELLLHFVSGLKLECYIFAQDWKDAMEFLLQSKIDRAAATGLLQMVRFTFIEGLVSMKAAQITPNWADKRKWKRKGQKSLKMLQGWAKKGNVNVVHMVHLLTAELASLQGKKEKAVENFKSAIAGTAKSGFLQDRALSHQLASAYFEDQRDDYWKDYHRKSAQRYYLEWGAPTSISPTSLNDSEYTIPLSVLAT